MAIARQWRQRKKHYEVPDLETIQTDIVPFIREAEGHSTAHRVGQTSQPIVTLPRFNRASLPLSVRGSVYSYTIITDAPMGFEEQAPYAVALIRLDDGTMMTAQVTDMDLDEIPAIGMRVELVTRRISSDGPDGVITYGYKFRPPIEL